MFLTMIMSLKITTPRCAELIELEILKTIEEMESLKITTPRCAELIKYVEMKNDQKVVCLKITTPRCAELIALNSYVEQNYIISLSLLISLFSIFAKKVRKSTLFFKMQLIGFNSFKSKNAYFRKFVFLKSSQIIFYFFSKFRFSNF